MRLRSMVAGMSCRVALTAAALMLACGNGCHSKPDRPEPPADSAFEREILRRYAEIAFETTTASPAAPTTFTALLLHDLGEGLSDGRPTFEASAREWRTAPLWGIGLVSKVNDHSFFLHDGRATNLSEAILWHDGEASSAREKFTRLPRADRTALLYFLQSL